MRLPPYHYHRLTLERHAAFLEEYASSLTAPTQEPDDYGSRIDAIKNSCRLLGKAFFVVNYATQKIDFSLDTENYFGFRVQSQSDILHKTHLGSSMLKIEQERAILSLAHKMSSDLGWGRFTIRDSVYFKHLSGRFFKVNRNSTPLLFDENNRPVIVAVAIDYLEDSQDASKLFDLNPVVLKRPIMRMHNHERAIQVEAGTRLHSQVMIKLFSKDQLDILDMSSCIPRGEIADVLGIKSGGIKKQSKAIRDKFEEYWKIKFPTINHAGKFCSDYHLLGPDKPTETYLNYTI